MSLEIYCGGTGSGKTALETYVSVKNIEENKYNRVYSNFNIKILQNIYE